MKGLLAWWEGLCASSKILRFVDRNLRGIGQVMFQDNPLSGLLFFVAIGWGSYAAGVPQVAIGGLVAVLAATLMAQWLRVDEAALNAGLYGFNAYLVGLALATFMAATLQLWVYAVFGGAVSVVVTLAALQRAQDLERVRADGARSSSLPGCCCSRPTCSPGSTAARCRRSARSSRSIRPRPIPCASAISCRGSSPASRRCS